jgi:hypothetical protein
MIPPDSDPAPPQPLRMPPSAIAPGEDHYNVLRMIPISWIEIELIGMDDKPIPGEKYRITLPNGSFVEGKLDDQGCARVEGFRRGACQITFPDLDGEAWEDADAEET